MKYLIIGAGGTGGCIGAYLAKAGKRDMAQDMYRRAKGLGAGEGTELQKLGAVLGEGND